VSSTSKKEPLQKSIVNLIADEVIKEGAEPAKHRVSNMSQLTKKTQARHSNLRHALADEKQKKLLENESNPLTKTNLQIQKKLLQTTAPREKPKRPVIKATADNTSLSFELSSIKSDAEVHSCRRSTISSQALMMNPTLGSIGPEVIVIKRKKEK